MSDIKAASSKKKHIDLFPIMKTQFAKFVMPKSQYTTNQLLNHTKATASQLAKRLTELCSIGYDGNN